MGRISRLIACLLSLLLISAPALPPEHSHPASADHGGVVHRHWSAHLIRHSAHPTLNDDDGRILWIDAGFVSAGGVHVAAPLFVGETGVLLLPSFVPLDLLLALDATRVHGPPGRTARSRAPPLSLSV